MKIVVFGTGYVGGILVGELADRGHEVTAVSRSGKTDVPAQVAAVTGSVYYPAFLSSVTARADAIVAALPALSPEGSLGAAVTALLQAAQESGARLGVVGGAAIIPIVPGGPRQADTPDLVVPHQQHHPDHQRRGPLAARCGRLRDRVRRRTREPAYPPHLARDRLLARALTDAGFARLESAWPTNLAAVRRHLLDHLTGIDLAQLARAMQDVAR